MLGTYHIMFLTLQRGKRVKPINRAVNIVATGKDPPGFYSQLVDHVTGKFCRLLMHTIISL